jgi:hypothetical protein
VRHEKQTGAAQQRDVVLHVLSTHVFQELHSPQRVKTVCGPPRSTAEVVVDDVRTIEEALIDGIIGTLYT